MKDFHLLGKKVRDRITGCEGVVTSISYDLYGCIQALVTSQTKEKENRPESLYWYDSKRLEVLDDTPAMEVPDFSISTKPPGGNALPVPSRY